MVLCLQELRVQAIRVMRTRKRQEATIPKVKTGVMYL